MGLFFKSIEMTERVEVRGVSFSDPNGSFSFYKRAIMIVGIFKGASYEGKRYH